MKISIPTSKGDTTSSKLLHIDLAPVPLYEVKTGNTIFLVAGKTNLFFILSSDLDR